MSAPLTHSPACLPQNPGLLEQYFSAILSLEPNQNYAGMLGLLVQFCTTHKEMGVVNQHKASGQCRQWVCRLGVCREGVGTCSVSHYPWLM